MARLRRFGVWTPRGDRGGQAGEDRDEWLRQVFEHGLEGILLTRPDGRILAANPAACRMLGRSEEELCRLGRQGLVDPEDTRVPHWIEPSAAEKVARKASETPPAGSETACGPEPITVAPV